MSSFVVYKHTNKINGKSYIGITSLPIKDRWREGKGYKNNKYFSRAIEKYGWDSFTHEILYEGLCEERAKRLEIELISHFESNNPSKGYNITSGGDGVQGFSHTEELKTRFSKLMSGKGNPMYGKRGKKSPHYGKKYSKKRCEKISRALKGKPKSDAHKRNLSESAKGRVYSPEARKKMGKSHYKPVAQYNLDGELIRVWEGIIVASEALGISKSSISGCCRKEPHRETAGGYLWEFVDRGDAFA